MKTIAIDVTSPLFTIRQASFKKMSELLAESGVELHAVELVDDDSPLSGMPPTNAQYCKSFVRVRRKQSDQDAINEHFSRLNSGIDEGRPNSIVLKNNDKRKYTLGYRYCCRKCETLISETKRDFVSRKKLLDVREANPASDTVEYDTTTSLDTTHVVLIDSSGTCTICG